MNIDMSTPAMGAMKLFSDTIIQVLPEHAHIKEPQAGRYTIWAATWSTQSGVWEVRCGAHDVRISGPMISIEMKTLDVERVILLLRANGCIDAVE